MTVFAYTACTAEGRKIHGIIEAESAPAAARMLMERGETAVRIEERRPLRLPQETRQWLSRRGGVTDEERIAFFQELSVLLAVGLPMHRALERLSDGVGEGVCEEGADAEGEACVEGGADGLGPDAELAAVQALRHPAVPAARASRKSRRCMGRTFLSTRERQATCVQNIM